MTSHLGGLSLDPNETMQHVEKRLWTAIVVSMIAILAFGWISRPVGLWGYLRIATLLLAANPLGLIAQYIVSNAVLNIQGSMTHIRYYQANEPKERRRRVLHRFGLLLSLLYMVGVWLLTLDPALPVAVVPLLVLSSRFATSFLDNRLVSHNNNLYVFGEGNKFVRLSSFCPQGDKISISTENGATMFVSTVEGDGVQDFLIEHTFAKLVEKDD